MKIRLPAKNILLKNKKTQLSFLINMCFAALLFISSSAYAGADTYYVTENGNGTKDGKSKTNAWSVSDFNNSANWSAGDSAAKIDPGDTIYFSGTITTRLLPPAGGEDGKYITLDGYEAGDTNPVKNGENTAACLIDTKWLASISQVAIWNRGHNYLIFQDFRIKDSGGGIALSGEENSDGELTHNIVRRNFMFNVLNAGININHASYTIVGGGPDQGNYLENCGRSDNYNERDPWFMNWMNSEHIILSHNKFYSTHEHFPGNGIEINGDEYGLIEYNISANMALETGLSIKEGSRPNKYLIVRFNRFYKNAAPGQGAGISVGGNVDQGNHHIYIYGNEIFENTAGIKLRLDCHHIYIWSNIIRNNTRIGITAFNGGQPGDEGKVNNLHIYNNIIAGNATDTVDQWADNRRGRTGLRFACGESDFYVKNNIFYNNRPNSNQDTLFHQIQLYSSSSAITQLEHNTYWHLTEETWPMYIEGTGKLNLSEMKNRSWEDDNPAGAVIDPELKAAASNDYRLNNNSSCIGSGIKINEPLPTLNINGREIKLSHDTGIDPNNTNWSASPPQVKTLTWPSSGNRDRGPYVYSGGGTIPPPPLNLRINN